MVEAAALVARIQVQGADQAQRDLKSVDSAIKGLAQGAGPAAQGVGQLDTRLGTLSGNAGRTGQSLGSAEQAMTRAGGASTRMNSAITGLTAGLGAMAGGAVLGAVHAGLGTMVSQVGASINAASDLSESMAKTGEVFRDSTQEVMDWSESSATAFGLSKQAALESASTFGNLFTAMGLATDASADMSTGMVELAADLASFNNIEIADAITALRAGIVGEVEPMRRLGVQINAVTVEAKAMEMGLAATKAEISEADKVMARYELILEQTGTAQGDFARTSDGLANQQRILGAQFDDIQAKLGAALLPAITDVTQALNNFVGSDAFDTGLDTLSEKIGEASDALHGFWSENKDQIADLAVTLGDTATEAATLAVNIGTAAQSLGEFLGQAKSGEDGGFLATEIERTNEDLDELNSHLSAGSKILQNEWPNKEEWQTLLGIPWWLPASKVAADYGAVVSNIAEDFHALQAIVERTELIVSRVFSESTGPAEEFTTELDRLRAMGQEVAIVIEDQARAFDDSTIAGHRHNQMLEDSVGSYDAAIVAVGLLAAAQQGLSETYHLAGANAEIFNTQSSEYGAIASDLTETYDILNKRKAEGIELSDEEIRFLDNYGENLGRVEGGMEDAAVQSGLYRQAQVDLMQAQDELNEAVKRGEEDLGPYQARLDDAETSLGDAATASGGMRTANELLTDAILLHLVPALDDIKEALDIINGTPATAEVDGDTTGADEALDGVSSRMETYDGSTYTAMMDADGSAAEIEIARIKAIIASGATLPISVSGGVGGGEKFASGGISEGGMAIVGEEGPELVFLPKGAEVLSHEESKRFLGGFAEGTPSTGSASKPGLDINYAAFHDVGTLIGEAIALDIQLGLIESGKPTGEEYAQAMVEGAVKVIEIEGADGVTEAWVVAHERLPDLVSDFGNDMVVALLQEYEDLRGELALAIISGEDTGEIQAQLDGIFAIFATWSGDSVEEVAAVWDAVSDAAKAEEAKALWEDVLGSINTPSAPVSISVDDIISGDALAEVQETFQELWDLQKMYEEAGMPEQAAAIGEQLKALGLQEELVNAIAGTDTAQKIADEIAAGAAAMQSEEAQKAIWETILAVPLEELASGDFAAEQQAKLDELYDDLSIAEALGLEDQVDEINAAIAEQEDLLAAAGAAMATPMVEAAAAVLDEIPELGAEGLAQLTGIFEEYPEAAVDMVDDLIGAVEDGRIPFEDAMALLAHVPAEDLIPALEALEKQLTVDLAGALLEFGPDSPQVQAILASLQLIASAAGATGDAIEELSQEQMGLLGAGTNETSVPGDTAYASGGGGTGVGGFGLPSGATGWRNWLQPGSSGMVYRK